MQASAVERVIAGLKAAGVTVVCYLPDSFRLILRSAHALRARVSKEEAARSWASCFETGCSARRLERATGETCLRAVALLNMRPGGARGSN
jgi:hypothetical protein